jgi:hypothetical protein
MGKQAERSERAAQRLERGLARSRAVVADYRARLLLLRKALREGQSGLRPAPAPQAD